MTADGKAMIDLSKALIHTKGQADNKAMLSTAEVMKTKLATVLKSGIKQSSIAQHCGVSKQAVQGWKNTGRIDKRHLQALAEVSGRPLSWWLELSDDEYPSPPQWPVSRLQANETGAVYTVDRPVWPFTTIDPRQYALLNEHQRSMVEAYAHGLIDGVTRNKRDDPARAA